MAGGFSHERGALRLALSLSLSLSRARARDKKTCAKIPKTEASKAMYLGYLGAWRVGTKALAEVSGGKACWPPIHLSINPSRHRVNRQ
jgi:hypothetical protein